MIAEVKRLSHHYKKAAFAGGFPKSNNKKLSRHLFQHLLIDVEVGVHVLHVVVIFQRFE